MKLCAKSVLTASVKTSGGEQSQLYQELAELFKDKEAAINAYLVINSDTFKREIDNWEINSENLNEQGEPNLDYIYPKLTEYINLLDQDKSNATLLSPQDQTFNENESKDDINANEAFNPNINDILEGVEEEDDTIQAKLRFKEQQLKNNNVQRLKNLIANKQRNINSLYRSMGALKHKKDIASIKEYNKLKNRRNNIIVEIQKLKAFESASVEWLVKQGFSNLEFIEDLINKGIRNNKAISFQDISYIRDVLDVWSDAKTIFLFGNENNIEMYNRGTNTTKGFNELVSRANELRDRFVNLQFNKYTQHVKEFSNVNEDYSVKEELDLYRDMGVLHEYGQHLGRTKLRSLSVLSKMHMMGIQKLNKKISLINARIDELSKDIKDYTIFEEKYLDGEKTGHIVTRFIPEFQVEYERILLEYSRKGLGNENKNAILNWINDNTIMIDPRLYFTDVKDSNGDLIYQNKVGESKLNTSLSTGDLRKSTNELIDILGEDEFKRQLNRARVIVESYGESRIIKIDELNRKLNNEEITDTQYEIAIAKWEAQNSPFLRAYNVTTGSPIRVGNFVYYNENEDTVIKFPRKHTVDQNNNPTKDLTGWMNKDFEKIKANPKLKDFHDFVIELNQQLKYILPEHIANNIGDNFIMQAKKSFVELASTELSNLSKHTVDGLRDLIAKYENDSSIHIDPFTGKKKYIPNVSAFEAYNAQVQRLVNIRTIEYKVEYNTEPSSEDLARIRKEARSELALGNTFKLPELLKIWNYQVQMYLHKTEMEDIAKSARDIINNAKESVNPSDREDTRKKEINRSFTSTKGLVEYWFDAFYGYDKPRSSNGKKLYNNEDKKLRADLDKALTIATNKHVKGEFTDEQFEEIKDNIEKAKGNLGKTISIEQTGRSIMTYTQYKGMAYNAPAAVVNIAHGYINNMIEAADGRIFTRPQIMSAYKEIFQSVIAFMTFNKVKTPAAHKIRNIISLYDIVSESSRELANVRNLKKKNAITDEYRFQNRSEYINQAPIVLAMLRNHNVEINKDGKVIKVALYDILDQEGRIKKDVDIVDKEGYKDTDTETGDELAKVMSKIAKSITLVHGNYNQHQYIKANEKILIAALKQFRTWMIEAFSQRVEESKFDEDLQITRKGRWRTGFGGFSFTKFNKSSYEGENDYLNANLFTMGEFLKSMIFMKTNLDSRFSEADAANFRKNMAEARIMLYLMGFLLMIGLMFDDDKNKTMTEKAFNIYKKIIKYLFNTTRRLIDDMSIYHSPEALQRVMNNPIPLTKTITEIVGLAGNVILLLSGHDEIQGGIYDGQSKMLRAVKRHIPVLNRLQTLESMTKQTYTSSNSLLDNLAKKKDEDED